jgi:DNA-binding MurR/RpiR family transcriptional regulator
MSERRNDSGASARIRGSLPAMTSAERMVAEWVLENPEPVLTLSMSQLADEIEVSDTTVLRMCRAAGFEGYTALKLSIAQDLVSPTHLLHHDLEEGDSPAAVVHKLFTASSQSMHDTLELLDPAALERVADYLETARSTLVCAVGASQIVAQSIDLRLLRLGLNCAAPADTQTQLARAALLEPGDLLIVVSYSGTTKDLLSVAELARGRGIRIVVITGNSASPLARLADECLVAVSREVRGEPYAAKLSQLAIVDALSIVYALRHLDATNQAETRIAQAIQGKHL